MQRRNPARRTPPAIHKVALVIAIAMLLSLPLAPRSDAQGDSSLPSDAEQQQAAKALLEQLDDVVGTVDPSTLSFDLALGPPPWLSFLPGRDVSTIEAWTELSTRVVDTKATSPSPSQRAVPGGNIAVQDVERTDEVGVNDTIATGQFVDGFGTGSGEQGFARIAGTLSSPPPPPPEVECPSQEEDGSIFDANLVPLPPTEVAFALCGGEIGDGTYGTTTGDIDFFEIGAVQAGRLITVDVGSLDPTANIATTTAVYSSSGTLLGFADDTDSSADSVLSVLAPADDVYYAAIAGIGALPTDPFDPSTGTGVTYVGDYLVFIGTLPAPPGACLAEEPDSSIPQANVLPFRPGETAPCSGVIGDGTFGDSTGDFDFFALDVQANSDIIVDIVIPPGAPGTATTVAVFAADGTLLGSLDDDGTQPSGFLRISADAPGTYYALVSSPGVLPSDPFDESSGTIAGPETSYVAFILSLPRVELPQPTPTPGGPTPTPGGPPPLPTPPPVPIPTPTPQPTPPGFAADARQAQEVIAAAQQSWSAATAATLVAGFVELDGPCAPTEDDGSISLANPATVDALSSVECIGSIGDGPFGTSTGDFDFYAVSALQGEAIVADTDAEALGGLDSVLAILDGEGNVLAQNDDFDGLDSRVDWNVAADGTYFVAVGAFGSVLADPFDSSSGSGATSTGPYILTIARAPEVIRDVDVYLIDLEVGDAVSAGFTMTGAITIIDPAGQVVMNSAGSAAFIYPLTSDLRHLGNVGADHVAEIAGTHAIVLDDGVGTYEGELRVKRAAFSDRPGDDVQTIFLDFDGGQFNQAIFDPFAPDNTGPVRSLSPLAFFLQRWGLSAADEGAVIDSIVAEFRENLLTDLQQDGGNGNRDATGIGGELDIEILNSRDHADPWGQPNVSRIIIGGTIDEAGISTIGIAQSIDPGNFEAEETAIVLLDLLSDPQGLGSPTLNDYGAAAPFTKIDVIGRGVGVIAAHEAGHFIGNWHTASFNGVPSVMDEGGDLLTTVGIGDDRILGTADDVDTDFVVDEFSFFEGFSGTENTTVRSAQALSTGQTNVDVVPDLEPPADGVYYIHNQATGRVLDADSNGDVDSSAVPRSDDRWELISIGDGLYNLRNVDFGTYLDADADGTVDQSQSPASDDRWQLVAADDVSFYLFSPDRGRYLSTTGVNVELSGSQTQAEQWRFEPVDVPPNPGGYVGKAIALQSLATDRWLDTDSNTNVDQSVTQRADDVWNVLDAGGGYVYLQNAVTNRYLDADSQDNNIETSSSPSNDDRWLIDDNDGVVTLRNAEYAGYLFAQGAADDFNVVRAPTISLDTQWRVEVLGV